MAADAETAPATTRAAAAFDPDAQADAPHTADAPARSADEPLRVGYRHDGLRISLRDLPPDVVGKVLLPFVGQRDLWRLAAASRETASAVAEDACDARFWPEAAQQERVLPDRLAAWAGRFTNARVLAVSRRGWSERPCGERVVAVVAAMAAMRSVEVLDLRFCALDGDGAAAALIAALPSAPPLRKLVLDRCRLGDDGLRALARALRHVPLLAVLDLRARNEDGMTAAGVRALIAELPHAPQLAVLSLRGNLLSIEALHELATMLPRMRHLRTLDLQRTFPLLPDMGLFTTMVAAARLAPKLQTLALGKCGMVSEAAQAELAALAPRLAITWHNAGR